MRKKTRVPPVYQDRHWAGAHSVRPYSMAAMAAMAKVGFCKAAFAYVSAFDLDTKGISATTMANRRSGDGRMMKWVLILCTV